MNGNSKMQDRRKWLSMNLSYLPLFATPFSPLGLATVPFSSSIGSEAQPALSKDEPPQKVLDARKKGLDWIATNQSRLGHWSAEGTYYAAMTALAGLALTCSGSTITQGPYSKNISNATDFLLSKVRTNGLIGDPETDDRYTYGHGFAMLFLSQVLGEEEDQSRRQEIIDSLKSAVKFSVNAQTKAGGWGYVSAKEGSDFDEGSTTITQVQGLRGCRNCGIKVPKSCIDRAIQYIYKCKNKDGGISYSSEESQKGQSRPAITAASLASLYNAGEYESEHVPEMWKYCKRNLHSLSDEQGWGHWHYTYLYYAQVVYRQKKEVWEPFRDRLYKRIIDAQNNDGSWTGEVASAYVTSCSLIMLQLDLAYLPIFQR